MSAPRHKDSFRSVTIARRWAPLLMLLSCLLALPAGALAEQAVLFEGESPYTSVTVYEKDNLRYLSFGVFEQTAIRPGDPGYLHYAYTRTLLAGWALAEPPVEKVLMVGLGGGAVGRFLQHHFPKVSLEAVEIDPLVVELADTYFGFREGPGVEVHVADGRMFMNRSRERYDVILLDAYKAGGIPFHLTTLEFLSLVRERLAPGGLAAFHLWGEHANPYLKAQEATLAEAFPVLYRFDAGEGSHVYFAAGGEQAVPRSEAVARAEQLEADHDLPFPLAELVENQYRLIEVAPDVPVLTDDHAPVNLLREGRGE